MHCKCVNLPLSRVDAADAVLFFMQLELSSSMYAYFYRLYRTISLHAPVFFLADYNFVKKKNSDVVWRA